MLWNAEQNNQLRPAEGISGSSFSSICVPTSAGFIGDKMKRISLTQGKYAVVDDEDFKQLSKHKWFARWSSNTKSFYAMRKSKKENGKQHQIYMHREILGLKKGDKRQSDHKDHVTLDNRRLNLRITTNQQNQFNQKNPKGYYWNKRQKMYLTQIKLNGKSIYLGYFQTAEEAHNTYLKAKEIYHKF